MFAFADLKAGLAKRHVRVCRFKGSGGPGVMLVSAALITGQGGPGVMLAFADLKARVGHASFLGLQIQGPRRARAGQASLSSLQI